MGIKMSLFSIIKFWFLIDSQSHISLEAMKEVMSTLIPVRVKNSKKFGNFARHSPKVLKFFTKT